MRAREFHEGSNALAGLRELLDPQRWRERPLSLVRAWDDLVRRREPSLLRFVLERLEPKIIA